MAQKLLILLGTRKGAFIAEADRARQSWSIKGPFCDASNLNHVAADEAAGTIYAGGGNAWTGPALWRSRDFGSSWTQVGHGFSYGDGEEKIKAVWSLAAAHGALYAGVEPAGLFRSGDGGESWTHVEGLRAHPTRPQWMPGGAGLVLHAVVPHPKDRAQIWVAISTGGVFHTGDGGESWEPRNRGTRMDYAPPEQRYGEWGQCVHALAMAPGNPDLLYQQNHCGMYRSADGGRSWASIEAGLPSTFGFPAACHPREQDTLYLVPLNGDSTGRFMPQAAAAVWRTRDGGRSWHDLRAGLPQENAYLCVLRRALATDALSPAGIYFGTNTGELFASADEGEGWTMIARHLPPITSVATMLADA
jgi:photosystem II stability/assembly factor-like uncharacterized protein